MEVFNFNGATREIEINDASILQIREFKALLDRDKTKTKSRAFREFTYIYLALDWQSPYRDYSELERHEECLADSGLSEKEFNDPIFREACRKYRNLQDSNKSIKLLHAAQTAADKLIEYFETILDFNERNMTTGAPIFKAKDAIAEMSNIAKVHEQLRGIEQLIKRDLTESSNIRGGAEDGFDPDDI